VIFIREFDLAVDIENSKIFRDNKAVNINRNKEVYDGLRKHLAKLTLVITFFDNL